MTTQDKKSALEEAIAKIEKDFGKGSVITMDGSHNVNVDVISTGNLLIDMATGIGGLPRGRVIEIYGPESSGKTTLALTAIAQCQKTGGVAAYIDAEHALDPVYAEALGVDLGSLYISQPDDGDQGLEIMNKLVSSGGIDIIVIDSVAALVPRAEIEGEISDNVIGTHARLMSKALRMLAGVINKTNTCVIFINQLREKVSTGYTSGPTETTTGGVALKYYASLRIDVRRTESLKSSNEVYGAKTKIKITKNKLAPPFKVVSVELYYGKGFLNEATVLDVAVENGIVVKKGAYYSYNDENFGYGKEATVKYLTENPEFTQELENKVREKLGFKTKE